MSRGISPTPGCSPELSVLLWAWPDRGLGLKAQLLFKVRDKEAWLSFQFTKERGWEGLRGVSGDVSPTCVNTHYKFQRNVAPQN